MLDADDVERDIWTALTARLSAASPALPPAVVARIVADLRQQHSKFVRALSLDDIERIAAALPPQSATTQT